MRCYIRVATILMLATLLFCGCRHKGPLAGRKDQGVERSVEGEMVNLQLPSQVSFSAQGQQVCANSGTNSHRCINLPERIATLQMDESGFGDVVASGIKQAYLLKLKNKLTRVWVLPLPESTGDSIVIDKSQNKLYWYRNGRFRARYPVATGRYPNYTPEGTFILANKIADPIGGQALKPQLGVRWLGLAVPEWADNRGPSGDERAPRGEKYGIHGTDEPASIGSHASGGCIRMRNKDIQVLYEQVSLGTWVRIQP